MNLTEQQNQAIKSALSQAGLRTAVSWDATGNPSPKRADVSDADYGAACAILGDPDLRRPRARRSREAIMADLDALSDADQRKLSLAIQAEYLQQNPRFARQLSIAVEGDEPTEN